MPSVCRGMYLGVLFNTEQERGSIPGLSQVSGTFIFNFAFRAKCYRKKNLLIWFLACLLGVSCYNDGSTEKQTLLMLLQEIPHQGYSKALWNC